MRKSVGKGRLTCIRLTHYCHADRRFIRNKLNIAKVKAAFQTFIKLTNIVTMLCRNKQKILKSELRKIPCNIFVLSAFCFIYNSNQFVPMLSKAMNHFFVFGSDFFCLKNKNYQVCLFNHFDRTFNYKFIKFGFHCSNITLKLISAGIYKTNRLFVEHRNSFYRITRNTRSRINDCKPALHKTIEQSRFSYVRTTGNYYKRCACVLLFSHSVNNLFYFRVFTIFFYRIIFFFIRK